MPLLLNLVEGNNRMHEQSYLVVNPLEDKEVIERFYHYGGGNAFPLYLDTEFDAQKEIGPWLLPYPPKEFLAYFANKPSGFRIYFSDDIETHIQHWKSLTFAGLDGELVLFRYYDRVVLEAMLVSFNQKELSLFLGSSECIEIISSVGSLCSYENSSSQVSYKSEPWWKIEKHHSSYSVERHAWITERLAWQRLPSLMKEIYEKNSDIQSQLINHLTKGRAHCFENEELEAYSMNMLIKNSKQQSHDIYEAWYLDSAQIKTVKQVENLVTRAELQQGTQI